MVYTDASKFAFGAVLIKEQEVKGGDDDYEVKKE